MKAYKKAGFIIIACVFLFCSGCAKKENVKNWIPIDGVRNNEDVSAFNESEYIQETKEKRIVNLEAEDIIDNNSDIIRDFFWSNIDENIVSKNSYVYYVSSSEGNDINSGLSKEKPKKSLVFAHGIDGITILLKAGDVFDMSDTLYLGSNVTLATYDGVGCELNYYQQLRHGIE